MPISFCTQTTRGNSLVVSQIIESPEASDAGLKTSEIEHHTYRTSLRPMLFHPREIVTIKIIIADYGGENIDINVTGRIYGIESIKKEAFVTANKKSIFELFFVKQEDQNLRGNEK